MNEVHYPRRDLVLGTVEDLVSSLLYYDRKEDEDLPVGEIEKSVLAGEVTVDEIVAEFARHIRAVLPPNRRYRHDRYNPQES
jgi:hypothetical protein